MKNFARMNKEVSNRKGGAGQAYDIEDLSPVQSYPDIFDEVDGSKNRNQSAVNGDVSGVTEGPVSCSAPADDRVAPKKGDATPGGGW